MNFTSIKNTQSIAVRNTRDLWEKKATMIVVTFKTCFKIWETFTGKTVQQEEPKPTMDTPDNSHVSATNSEKDPKTGRTDFQQLITERKPH